MTEIKTYKTFNDFLKSNESEILNNYYVYYNFLRTLDDINNEKRGICDSFNIIDEFGRTIICIWAEGTLFFYSSDYTEEMITKIQEKLEINRFTNYAFLGQRDLVLEILNRAGVQLKSRKNRIVYTCTQVNPISNEINGIVENASIFFLDQLINMGIQYYQEEFEGNSLKTNDEIAQGIIKSIEDQYLYCLRIDDKIHSILKVISYDREKPMIGHLFTLPTSRNKGFAYKLLYYVTQGLLSSKFKICGLLSNADNPASNKVFLKIGYVPIYDLVHAIKEN